MNRVCDAPPAYVRYEVQFGRLVQPANTFVADEAGPYDRTPVTTCAGCQ